MEFPRQAYWSALPFPSPGHLPDPGIEPLSLVSPTLAGRSFTTSSIWTTNQKTNKKKKSSRPWCHQCLKDRLHFLPWPHDHTQEDCMKKQSDLIDETWACAYVMRSSLMWRHLLPNVKPCCIYEKVILNRIVIICTRKADLSACSKSYLVVFYSQKHLCFSTSIF